MKENASERAATLGSFIAENGATVRETAKKFGISKSTVHKDVTEKLRHENIALFERVRAVLKSDGITVSQYLQRGSAP